MIDIFDNRTKLLGDVAERRDFDFLGFMANTPIYQEETMTRNQLGDMAEKYNGERIKLENFCSGTDCKKERVFESLKIDLSHITGRQANVVYSMQSQKRLDRKGEYQWSNKAPLFTQIILKCTYCDELHSIALYVREGSLTKIGQFPSPVKEYELKYQKYAKQLGRYYNELLEASFSFSTGQGIGAFVYLRRILEHLVNTKYQKLPKPKEKAKFQEKMTAVERAEKIIPPDFTDERDQLYTLLSNGVHRYTEQECRKLYPFLKMLIECILDKELAKKEEAQKIKDAKIIMKKKIEEDR
ncbi:hypothetical protein [Mycoplasma sp. ATU-Cv-703]|uniref:hypothetical protein n=1 Tax=Mycoplasma sp. ATU-Cv-703 TaxID=2498595 RepID=UPI000FDEABA1